MFFRKKNQPCPLELLAWRSSLPPPHCPDEWHLLGPGKMFGLEALWKSRWLSRASTGGGERKLGTVLLAGPIESPSTGGEGEIVESPSERGGCK